MENDRKERMKRVYVCSPFAGDIRGNIAHAKIYSLYAIKQGVCPITPHLMFTQYLNEKDPVQRELGLRCGADLLQVCDELWVFGDDISEGMSEEIRLAKKLGIPVRRFRQSFREVAE